MAVYVSFASPLYIGSTSAPGVGSVRARENLALNGTTTATVADGEFVVVANAETSMIAVAFGSAPNAAATAETAATSAGFCVAAGAVALIPAPVGSKINVKAP